MKSPAGQPRARRPVQKKPVQLNLRRTPTWPEEDEASEQPDSHFWRWFALVLFLHVLAFIFLLIAYRRQPPPPEQFINLVPPGDVVKGTPGEAAAHKIAPTTPAPSHAEESTPPPPPPKPITPKPKLVHKVEPVVTPPKPPPIISDKAITPAPPVVKPKPKPPKPPKVKVDLSQLVDAPDADEPAPAPKPKPKPHLKKKTVTPPKDAPASATDSDTDGLSREEVAKRLGDKLKASGVEHADKTGVNGSSHSTQSDYSDFYQAIHDQVMNKWSVPNFVDQTAVDPVVQIHVDKDGRVPPELVSLKRSSNNPAFDQSALEAARNIGYTLQPLPDGCPPDISITFNLHQQ